MIAFWFSRLVHGIRQMVEDRSVPEASTVQQWKRMWATEPRKVVKFRNLLVIRETRRKVA